MNKTDEELNQAEKMAKRHGVRMCDENGDTHGEELYCVGIEDVADIIREALADHIADAGKVIPQFIPVGIVNDHHSITWMEEIVDDQAPIGAILYALQDSVGRNVSFAKEQK